MRNVDEDFALFRSWPVEVQTAIGTVLAILAGIGALWILVAVIRIIRWAPNGGGSGSPPAAPAPVAAASAPVRTQPTRPNDCADEERNISGYCLKPGNCRTRAECEATIDAIDAGEDVAPARSLLEQLCKRVETLESKAALQVEARGAGPGVSAPAASNRPAEGYPIPVSP